MNRTLIENLIAKHEGRRPTVYIDSVGKQTIGIGFNLDAPDAQAICKNLGMDYPAILAGDVLSDGQIDSIFDYQLNKVIAQAQITLPTFTTMPDEVQAVVCDMIFNLGWAGFQSFQHTIYCLKSGSWKDAAANMKTSKWAQQVPNRANEDMQLLEAA